MSVTPRGLQRAHMRGERGGVAGSQLMSTAVHRSPNKLWRSNAIFNLWSHLSRSIDVSSLSLNF